MLRFCLPVGAVGPEPETKIHCLLLEPTDECRFKDRSSSLLVFRRRGLAIFDHAYKPFLGLGPPDTLEEPQVSERKWTRKPVVLESQLS
jgi:hypothetical protein